MAPSSFSIMGDLYIPGALDVLAVTFILFWVVLFLFQIIAIVAGKLLLYNYNPSIHPEECPSVSILKPLAGEEPNSLKNLQTFFELNYPKKQFEVLFCTKDEQDPAVAEVRQLMELFPEVNSRLFTDAKTIGINPKINNMNQGYKAAKHDLLWVCDSAIKVHEHTLQELVSHIGPGVGMVHQLPFVATAPGFAAVLDKVYFGTQHAFVYLFANGIGLLCANGMSTLYNKHVLDDLGGLEAFSCYVAEDYFISKAISKRGFKVAFSSEPAIQNPSVYSLQRYQNRMLRWTRLRLMMEPFPSFLEPLTECVVFGVLCSWAVSHLWGISMVLFFIKHVVFFFFLDFLLLKIVQGTREELPPFWTIVGAWLFREFTFLIFFLQAALGRQIEWRTTSFKLMFGGKAELLHQEKCLNVLQTGSQLGASHPN